ncbi:hypothetical protein CZ771_12820 [Actinomycetales bacterium JB111]|nr:hypothetical protein CZ771_12820 [Actinomycetales bacterium JB111]
MSERIPVVYGYLDHFDSLSILPEQYAIDLAEEIQAVANARTWGEARRVEFRRSESPVPGGGEPR